MKTRRLLSDSLMLGLMLGAVVPAHAQNKDGYQESSQQFEAILGSLAGLGEKAQKLAAADIENNPNKSEAAADEAELRLLDELSKISIGKSISGLPEAPAEPKDKK